MSVSEFCHQINFDGTELFVRPDALSYRRAPATPGLLTTISMIKYSVFSLCLEDETLFQIKNLELGLVGSAWRQSQNPSLVRLWLQQVLNFQAEFGWDLKKMEIYKLSLARAGGK